MKGKLWAGAAAAAVLCILCGSALLWPRESRAIGQARAAVESAAPAGNETRYRAFLQAVDSVKTMDANRNKGVAVTPGDPLLILSTTRAGSSEMSYLVLAKGV